MKRKKRHILTHILTHTPLSDIRSRRFGKNHQTKKLSIGSSSSINKRSCCDIGWGTLCLRGETLLYVLNQKFFLKKKGNSRCVWWDGAVAWFFSPSWCYIIGNSYWYWYALNMNVTYRPSVIFPINFRCSKTDPYHLEIPSFPPQNASSTASSWDINEP